MVIIAIPKDVTERKEKTRARLEREVIKAALDMGVPWELIKDDAIANESIDDISSRIEFLRSMLVSQGTQTYIVEMDNTYFKPIRERHNKSRYIFDQQKRFKEMEKLVKDKRAGAK